jgi:hypothetical protein
VTMEINLISGGSNLGRHSPRRSMRADLSHPHANGLWLRSNDCPSKSCARCISKPFAASRAVGRGVCGPSTQHRDLFFHFPGHSFPSRHPDGCPAAPAPMRNAAHAARLIEPHELLRILTSGYCILIFVPPTAVRTRLCFAHHARAEPLRPGHLCPL